jgi:hypothetical protein
MGYELPVFDFLANLPILVYIFLQKSMVFMTDALQGE